VSQFAELGKRGHETPPKTWTTSIKIIMAHNKLGRKSRVSKSREVSRKQRWPRGKPQKGKQANLGKRHGMGKGDQPIGERKEKREKMK